MYWFWIAVQYFRILKYEFCYALNRMWAAVIFYGLYGASIATPGDWEILFYTDSVEKLPICLCINLIYAILSYAGCHILNVIVRSYRRESNGAAAYVLMYRDVLWEVFFSLLWRHIRTEFWIGACPYPAVEKRRELLKELEGRLGE